MPKRSKFFQKNVREVQSNRDSSNSEQSAYWLDVTNRSFGEHVLANPDALPETDATAPSTPQLIMGEAISHLAGRQKEVYLLTMREGKSLAEVAEILGIEKGTAQKYRERAIKFIEGWCRAAIERGRV